ncbi:Rv3235 family protein [Solwaraspora sp. WMMD1047]|uniref:Rv3235 family protein n=1 Tax=Solwaraspora sp. WMMD1047 TaxID=3016102 RepID=UPI0024173397|nr:Rv3235 family protein [Solwaraspora sp. WMMD1047]MDG4833074.1 Rv3235 family protein [Solwaraspora sp. WMMD1047]
MVATTARARQPVRPRVLLRAVPALDPPYEDETDPVRWSFGPDGARFDPGQLALQLSVASDATGIAMPGPPPPDGRRDTVAAPTTSTPLAALATATAPAPSGAATPGAAAGTAAPGVATPGAASGTVTPVAALATATPEAERAARRFLGCCLEVLNGYRPAAQLRPLLAPAGAATMIEHLVLATGLVPARPRGRPGTPPGARPAGSADPVRLRRFRVCEPAAGVAETAAALGVAGRTWAMAFRLERRRGSWLGTTAQVWAHRVRGATDPGTGRTC